MLLNKMKFNTRDSWLIITGDCQCKKKQDNVIVYSLKKIRVSILIVLIKVLP